MMSLRKFLNFRLELQKQKNKGRRVAPSFLLLFFFFFTGERACPR